MFSQRNNPYCELISNCETQLTKKILTDVFVNEKKIIFKKNFRLITPF